MWQIFKKSILANIAFLALSILVGYGAYNVVFQALVLRGESRGTDVKIQALLKKKAELEQYTAELQSRQAVEREAKERLNLKLPGEEVVVVVPEKKPEISQQLESRLGRTKSFFKHLLSW